MAPISEDMIRRVRCAGPGLRKESGNDGAVAAPQQRARWPSSLSQPQSPPTVAAHRQRAEHNEGLLSTLEEVALHQQSIERIELLGHLCPRLRILYLQNNLISKIENLNKLKVLIGSVNCAHAAKHMLACLQWMRAWTCNAMPVAVAGTRPTMPLYQMLRYRNTMHAKTPSQDLSYLNLALNNITKVQNLQRCESLTKLDLTANFIPKAGLLSLASLAGNYALRELFLVGNPCADWPGYRQYVLGVLPQLARLVGAAGARLGRLGACALMPWLRLRGGFDTACTPLSAPHLSTGPGDHPSASTSQDGKPVTPSERIAAGQAAPSLAVRLREELAGEGVDAGALGWEDDGAGGGGGEVEETGCVGEDGQLRRPWCPATRILEHREQVRGAGGGAYRMGA